MEQCTACRAEVADYDRRCWNCGAGVKRDSDMLLSSGPTEKELSQARLGHLLALPGMLILGVLFYAALGMFGLLGLVPLNLIIPFVYWLGCVDILGILFVISAQAVIGTKMNGTTPTSSFPRKRESSSDTAYAPLGE